ncbi:AI-2E family transporter [Basilea psittacipulmonis]|uniref:Membrane protein n=1 Tax=Basilea psittacipulmonis DSM 24701 TaxID=1072685 RepID=A0A077DIG4_9BURK|nr:AI-2E family transporter [Basilea psittacipulmonis]AIL32963.1 membrane protein [Basilea psittacipulmonis DSM 24701]
MKSSTSFQYYVFLFLLAAVSLAFFMLIKPYFSAILWAVILALIFRPAYIYIERRIKKPTISALLTELLIILIALIPLSLLMAALTKEVVSFYQNILSGQINIGAYLSAIFQALPDSVQHWLHDNGWEDVSHIQDKLRQLATKTSGYMASQAVSIGSDTFSVVVSLGIMLYLLFFFLRDGRKIFQNIATAVPLGNEEKLRLFKKFTAVSKATVKGNFLIALIQGILGGAIFWMLGINNPLLWTVVMAFLSLLPAIGSAIVWLPTSVYLLAVGDYISGVVLLLWGVVVMGLADNFLRPILVGKSTRLPDYLVLISTLGGLALFGIDGLVLGPLIAALFLVLWELLSSYSESP